MKRFWLVVMSVCLAMSMVLNVYAIPFNPNDYTSVNEYSELLPKHVKEDKVSERAVRRGDFLIGADLIISNKGDGNIGAFAKALIEIPVQEAYISIYLDRWNDQGKRWDQIMYYDAEFYAEDYPDGLRTPTVDTVFENQPSGFYRLRAAVAAYNESIVEAYSPMTAGIWV